MTSFIRFFLSLFGLAIRKPAKIGEAWTGYGPVNRWHETNAGWIKDLARNGIKVAHIEFFGWGHHDAYPHWDRVEKRYKELVKACRMYGVTLLVSIINDNKGSRKYGDDGIPAAAHDEWNTRAVRLIKRIGTSFVWVQPVGETQTGYGREFERRCTNDLSEFTLIYNGGSRPTGTPPGYAGFAWHPFNTRQTPPAGAIVVTDTGPILTELQGDLFGAHAVTDVLRPYGDRMTGAGHAIIHYGFMHPEIDKNSVEALKR